MKVIVFGSNGMAGHVVTKYLRNQGHTITTVARSDADIVCDCSNIQQVDTILDSIVHNYDYVINCVGLLVKDSIDRPHLASIINSWFPHYLEYRLKNSYTKLIHLSTDCVFNGSTGNYIESDIHTESNVYGRSKSLGEVNNCKDVTFRMSIIGPELKATGTGLFNWVVNNTSSELPGWTNAYWNGITTLQLAKCIDQYMNKPCINGVYHLVNNDVSINKYELLVKINTIFNLSKVIKAVEGPKSINKLLVDTRKLLDFGIPDYDVQLLELREFMTA